MDEQKKKDILNLRNSITTAYRFTDMKDIEVLKFHLQCMAEFIEELFNKNDALNEKISVLESKNKKGKNG